MILQVQEAEKALKMKIRPRNAFLSCYKLNFLAAMPREFCRCASEEQSLNSRTNEIELFLAGV
jgi:hypothetical protein